MCVFAGLYGRGPVRPEPSRISRLRYRLTLVLCTLVVLGTIGTWWIERRLSGPLIELARVRAANLATAAINGAVGEVLAGRLDGLVFVEQASGADGAPFIRYNMGRLNQVMSDAVQAILGAFEGHDPQEFEIPLGELSGLTFFAAWGPSLPARIFTTGSVVVEPKVDFLAAGINQVVHRIYLDVTVRMLVVAPFVRDAVVVRQPVIVTEEILSGGVPGTYVNLVGFTGGMEEWLALLARSQGGAAGSAGGSAGSSAGSRINGSSDGHR